MPKQWFFLCTLMSAVPCHLVAGAVGRYEAASASYLKTFTSTFSRPSILSSSFNMDPMRLRAACRMETLPKSGGFHNQTQSRHIGSALSVMHLTCSDAHVSCLFTACAHCKREHLRCNRCCCHSELHERYRCQPGQHEQGAA